MHEPLTDEDTPRRIEIPCFRCGVCCMRYSPKVIAAEAEQVADSLGISLEMFLERYVDDSWFEPGFYLLDTHDGACSFLTETGDKRIYSCRIHSIRPQVCREWQPGLERKECLEGLQNCWGLTVDVTGRLQGSQEKVQKFRAVLESEEYL